jgi:acetylornithine deacetylase/succinyl-diaminopimelate desuccinylase-like protein
VAGLRDRDGRITVAGWSDEVRPLTAEETEALAAVPDVDGALRDELSLAETEAGNARLVERIMLPALNVRGLQAGAVGESAANAIPVEARASFDFRLVPDQNPDVLRQRFEAHLRAAGYAVVHEAPTPEERRRSPRLVRLEWEKGYPAARTSLGLPFSRALVRAVAAAGDGTVVSLPTLGGSVPLHVFAEAFGVPVVGLPIVNHDNAQHAADENLRLANLWDGIAVFASVFTGLGADPGWR